MQNLSTIPTDPKLLKLVLTPGFIPSLVSVLDKQDKRMIDMILDFMFDLTDIDLEVISDDQTVSKMVDLIVG